MQTSRLGFTIIELTLVLAITGLMAMGILVGIGASLRNQRYTEATNQAIDYFQGLYDRVLNLSNDRPGNLTCSSSGIDSIGGQGRGTSGCLLLGLLITSDDGENITTRQVAATRDVSGDPTEATKTDSEVLADSQLVTLDGTDSTYTMDWGTTLMSPGASNGLVFSMMIVRQPVTGVVRTFIDMTSSTISLTNLTAKLVPVGGTTFCVDPTGLMNFNISRAAFIVDQGAANSSAVRQLGVSSC